jgi:hypothetical protein
MEKTLASALADTFSKTSPRLETKRNPLFFDF